MRRAKGFRSDGWPNDEKAPDGFTVNGVRRVSKSGVFKFCGTRWQSEFEPGAMIYVQLSCSWGTSVTAVVIDKDRFYPDNIIDQWVEFVEWIHAIRDRDRIIYIDTEAK